MSIFGLIIVVLVVVGIMKLCGIQPPQWLWSFRSTRGKLAPKPTRPNVFKGTLTGRQFFWWYLPAVLMGAVIKILPDRSDEYPMLLAVAVMLVAALYFLSHFVAIIAAVRRCHDIGISGWVSLICLLPFASWYFVFAKGRNLKARLDTCLCGAPSQNGVCSVTDCVCQIQKIGD